MGFLDGAGLAHVWKKVNSVMSAKQDKLTGTEGQVVGFNAQGQAVAQDAPECVSMEQVEAAIRPALEVIEATLAPARTVEVAASELPTFINALPRLLTENLTITVTGGTGAGVLYIIGFYGPGSLIIQAADGAEVVFEVLQIKNCSIFIRLKNLKVQNTSNAVTAFGVENATVIAEDCSASRAKIGSASGISVTVGGAASLFRCDFQNCVLALNVQTSGILSVIDCTGSNNNIGCAVLMGGTILLSGTTPDLMGGIANSKSGGLIVGHDGMLL